jgi:aspartate/methionine/tyrosine aminotransferase
LDVFRIEFAIGNAEVVTALRKIKAIIDSNQYREILKGKITAIEDSQETVKQTVAEFRKRRDVLIEALNNINWLVEYPQATMYFSTKSP